MSEIKHTRRLMEKAQREERKASDEMFNSEKQANEQQSQLDTLLVYREECLSGLKTAKESRLSVVQVRECQLLVQYLDSVVETRQYQVDISQENYEKFQLEWKKKNEHYLQIKEKLEQMEAEANVLLQEQMIGGDEDEVEGLTYRTYVKKQSH